MSVETQSSRSGIYMIQESGYEDMSKEQTDALLHYASMNVAMEIGKIMQDGLPRFVQWHEWEPVIHRGTFNDGARTHYRREVILALLNPDHAELYDFVFSKELDMSRELQNTAKKVLYHNMIFESCVHGGFTFWCRQS